MLHKSQLAMGSRALLLATLLSVLIPATARGGIVAGTTTPTATSTVATPTPSAVRTPPGAPAVKCQAAIKKAGAKFVGKKLANLDKCTTGISKCIQTKADGPEQQACVVKAGQKCAQAEGFAKIAAEEDKLVASVRKSCEAGGSHP